MLYFVFQKVTYWFNTERKQFQIVDFPVDLEFREYLECKGLDDDTAGIAVKRYGDNQFAFNLIKFCNIH